MPFSWIDMHAHLEGLAEGALDNVMETARQANVGPIVSTSTDLVSAKTVLEQCARYPDLYGALGISPFDVGSLPGGWEKTLGSLLENDRIIAVGEIGIDDSNPRYPPLAAQLPVFEHQLAIAGERNLPAVIHSRGAELIAAEICKNLRVAKAVFHCFTGSPEALRSILDYGYYVSFSGIITFSTPVRDLLSLVPLDRLFIETDTPYLAPIPHRGKTNQPAWVGLVGEAAAKQLSVTPEKLQEIIAGNFKQLFFGE